MSRKILNTKDLTGRQIVNVHGNPQAKVPWEKVPILLRTSLDRLLDEPPYLQRVSFEKPEKGPFIAITNWVEKDRLDWTNVIQFGINYFKTTGFTCRPDALVLNVVYQPSKKTISPMELWLGNGYGGYFTGNNLYSIDSESYKAITAYARRVMAKGAKK